MFRGSTRVRAMAIVMLGACAWGQAARPRPRFDVVSIKPYTSHATFFHSAAWTPFLPGAKYVNPVVTLERLVVTAYSIPHDELDLLGLPPWAKTNLYAIDASCDESALQGLSPAEAHAKLLLMLQAMLAERFQLKLHTESRAMTVLALRLAGNGVKNMTQVSAAGTAKPSRDAGVTAGLGDDSGRMIGNGASMADLARVLTAHLDKPVTDETGVGGYFDFDIRWTAPPLADGTAPPEQLGASGIALLISQLHDQLGLRLQRTKGTEKVWVVDHVETPTAN